MDPNIKQIVSMLVGYQKVTLFTIEGDVLDMKIDGPHDTTAISEFLAPQITGTSAVEIDLNDYLSSSKALAQPEYEEDGIVITQIVNGKEVQGIFYPQKVEVQVKIGEDEPITIPNVEKLDKQMQRASDESSPSVRNFLKRLAPVVKDRLHSAEDLMAFIERSELPLTNDGRIIGYKRVNKRGSDFVDCYSGKVIQNVGDRVWMDIDGVDPDRNRSCSHGLHVANLGYLQGFSGSHTLIVLVDPENFIAVPHGETTKCRVCSYDVVGVISGRGHEVMNKGSHIDGDISFEKLISETVEGNTPSMRRTVKVGQREVLEILPITQELNVVETNQTAQDVVEEIVDDVIAAKTPAKRKPSGKSLETDAAREKKDIKKMASKTKAASQGKNLWDNAPSEVLAVFEDMRSETLSKSAIASKHNTSTRTMGRWADKYDCDGWVKSRLETLTVPEQARQFFVQGAFDALAAFKKAKKKSYSALGFTSKEEKTILGALA